MTTKPIQTYLGLLSELLLAAVIATTLLARYNFNGQLIIALFLTRFVQGHLKQRLILAGSSLFLGTCILMVLVNALGLLHTSDLPFGWYLLQKRATLAAIPFILLTNPKTGIRQRHHIQNIFCGLLLFTSLYCLFVNSWIYSQHRDISVFFYHSLVTPISQNAIFFSAFMMIGLNYLLFGYDRRKAGTPSRWKNLRIILIGYFIVFILLLASKLMLVLLGLVITLFLVQRRVLTQYRKIMLGAGFALLSIVIVFALTKNPIRTRYQDIFKEAPVKTDKISPGTYFNGLQLRLVEWKFGLEIIRENGAWLLGVSPGDAQHKLDRKYMDANMYLGKAGTADRGFLNYNFHNQFLEEFVQSGLAGLAALLFACVALIRLALRAGNKEAGMTVVVLLSLFFTESSLQMQTGLFLFAFFPPLLSYSEQKT